MAATSLAVNKEAAAGEILIELGAEAERLKRIEQRTQLAGILRENEALADPV